mmetsp:Transcript_27663/g.56782  ORF Transcript_27663/g.56782 Transcript_27663/m.56782 type:complete len:362 (-) Transcript_27663:156-1241(-)
MDGISAAFPDPPLLAGAWWAQRRATGLAGAALLKLKLDPGLGPALNARRASRSLAAASFAATRSASNNTFPAALSLLQSGASRAAVSFIICLPFIPSGTAAGAPRSCWETQVASASASHVLGPPLTTPASLTTSSTGAAGLVWPVSCTAERSVLSVRSKCEHAGETQHSTAVSASSIVNASRKTRVSNDSRYGTYAAPRARAARHVRSAMSDELISAASLIWSFVWYAVSMVPSLPARSMMVRVPPPCMVIWYTACDRELEALVPVAAVSRRADASPKLSRSSCALAATRAVVPRACVAPLSATRRCTSRLSPSPPSKSKHRLLASSYAINSTLPPAATSSSGAASNMRLVEYVLPEPVMP